MSDRICIVTGANAGIGKAISVGLANLGAHVIMVCRDRSRGEDAQRELQAKTGNSKIDLMVADLSDISAVYRLAEEFKATYPRLDVLINNATAIFAEREVSVDGIEMNFALNYLSYFNLSILLTDSLKASPVARVINMSTEAHHGASLYFDDLYFEKAYNPIEVYLQAKLAVLLFTYEFSRRYASSGVKVNCLDPGVIDTKALSDIRVVAQKIYGKSSDSLAAPPEIGAKTPLYLATAHEVSHVTGCYFIEMEITSSSPASYNLDDASRLWEISVNFLENVKDGNVR